MDRSFLFVLGSSRPDGNTEQLARTAARRLLRDGTALARPARPAAGPFTDRRHADPAGHTLPAPGSNERLLLDATLDATDIVIASPVYWYSVSSATKLYLDHWSGWLRLPGVDFKQRMARKTYWAVSALAEEDPAYARPLLDTVRYSAEYFGARFAGGLVGVGVDRPGQIMADAETLARARGFFTADATGPLGLRAEAGVSAGVAG
ncbi:flavodoxin family protein [Streptacidiphilus monticola]